MFEKGYKLLDLGFKILYAFKEVWILSYLFYQKNIVLDQQWREKENQNSCDTWQLISQKIVFSQKKIF